MASTINKYNNGKIYFLYCNDNYYYIGSTINELNKRLNYHKKCSKQFPNRKLYSHINSIGWDSVNIELLEEYSCNNIKELHNKEDYYIRQYIDDTYCLNIKKVVQTKEELLQYAKEYRDDHKEQISEYKINYNILNLDKKREYNKKYVEENKEIIEEKRKKYYEQNKEKVKEKIKKYVEQNKEIVAERKKNWAEKNKELLKEKTKIKRKENKEKIQEKGKQYYEENKEIILKKFKEYRLKNKEDLLKKQEMYRALNKEKIKCNCGGTYIELGKHKHEKTKKHLKYMNNIDEKE